MACALCLAPAVFAQTAQAPGLSVSQIESKLETAKQATGLSADQRSEIERLYADAKRFVDASVQSAGRLADYTARIRQAPERVAGAQAVLQSPLPSWKLAGTSTSELEQQLRVVVAVREAEETRVASLGSERQNRVTRLQQLPQQQASQKAQQAQIRSAVESPVDSEPPILVEARSIRKQAQLQSLDARVAEFDAEARVYAAEAELLVLQEKRAEAVLAAARSAAEDFEKRLQEQRKLDALRDAEKAKKQAEDVHPALEEIADTNREIADRRQAIAADLELVSAALDSITKRRSELETRIAEIRKRIQIAGLTDAIGLQLRQEKAKLPNRAFYQRRAAQRRAAIVDAQLAQIDFEERGEVLDQDGEKTLRSLVAKIRPNPGFAARAALQAQGLELLRVRKAFLEDASRDASAHVLKLVALDTEERLLLRSAEAFANFVDERVLWIRSTKPIWETDATALTASLRWLADPGHWAQIGPALLEALRRQPLNCVLGLLIVFGLLLARFRVRRRITQLGELAGKRLTTSIAPTLAALVWTALHALAGPLLVYLIGSQLARAQAAGAFVQAMAEGLVHAAIVYAGLNFVRQMLRPGGLGEAHFKWSPVRARAVRVQLTWFIPLIVPLSVVLRALTVHAYVPWAFALDRLVLILVLLLIAVLLWKTLNLRTGVLARVREGAKVGSFARFDRLWFGVAVLAPLALAALAIAGYHFTSLELLYRLERSLAVGVAALVFYAVAIRWMLLAKRRLAIQQAKARQAAAKKAREADRAGEAEDTGQQLQAVEEAVDLASVDAQSRKVVRGAVALLVVLSFWGIWADVLPALGLLDDVELWQSTSEVSRLVDGKTVTEVLPSIVSLGSLLLSLLLLVATFAVARNVPGILELTVLQRFRVQAGERYAITTLARYAIVTGGIIAAFGVIGIGWGKVQWLVAAVSVGLGFGLQEIFANFVSGLIILFERPVRIGDLVTVGGVDGYVTRIRMRATTILDFDRRELIVPNKEFVTARLVNWTLTDPITRVIVRVGIAYGSDVKLARDLLMQVASESDYVLEDPAPAALFLGFGDSSLDFELRVFTASRNHWPQLRDGLHSDIDEAFRGAGIEIPFPQRDIHIRSDLRAAAGDGHPA